MRAFSLLTLLLVSAPAFAQGIYVSAGTGGSLSYARSSTDVISFGEGNVTFESSAVGAALETVSGRGQLVVGVSYASPVEGVSVYGLSTQFGFLVTHQHQSRGQGVTPTLALNGGLAAVFATAEGVSSQTTQFVSFGPELGVAFPLSPSAALVPSAAFQVAVPFGVDGAETSTGFGGAVGVSIGSQSGYRFVFEPGLSRSGDTTTFSFSLKMFAER